MQIEQMEKVLSDENIIDQLLATESIDDVKKVFFQEGLELSDEETKAFIMMVGKVSDTDELKEKELEDVSGGGFDEVLWMLGKVLDVLKKYGKKAYDLGQKFASMQ